jgi:hypothetical protein
LQLNTAAACERVNESQQTILKRLQSELLQLQNTQAQVTKDKLEPLQASYVWGVRITSHDTLHSPLLCCVSRTDLLRKELAAAEAEKARLSKNTVVDTQKQWFTAANSIMGAANAVSVQWKPHHVLAYSLNAAPRINGYELLFCLLLHLSLCLCTHPFV